MHSLCHMTLSVSHKIIEKLEDWKFDKIGRPTIGHYQTCSLFWTFLLMKRWYIFEVVCSAGINKCSMVYGWIQRKTSSVILKTFDIFYEHYGLCSLLEQMYTIYMLLLLLVVLWIQLPHYAQGRSVVWTYSPCDYAHYPYRVFARNAVKLLQVSSSCQCFVSESVHFILGLQYRDSYSSYWRCQGTICTLQITLHVYTHRELIQLKIQQFHSLTLLAMQLTVSSWVYLTEVLPSHKCVGYIL